MIVVPSLHEAWDEVLAPWFAQVLPDAWARSLPPLVVVPTRGQINALKARLVATGQSHLGLQFATPATLRGLLARDDPRPPAKPEHLRLLLAIAASEMENSEVESEALAAKSVSRAPAPLLRALDRLTTAGWKFDELGLKTFGPIVRRFNALLKKTSFVLPGELDRQRLRAAESGPLKFSHLLVTGFDGAHWADWFLLRSAIALAESTTLVLEEPSLSDADFSWIGSWEEICGEAQRATSGPRPLGDSLFSEAEMRGDSGKPKSCDFLIGTNISEQAEAVARQCVRYLADEKCTRLGVIFPGDGALPRLAASVLARHDIPHHDGLAHKTPGIFETAEWQTWLELQRGPGLESFIRFLNALADPTILSSRLNRAQFDKILRDAYGEVLIDDLDLLAAFCGQSPSQDKTAAAEALGKLPLLPARASLEEFLDRTKAALEYLGWKQHALALGNFSRDWPRTVDAKFSRALFLRWLQEAAASFEVVRSEVGNHPYARVQLLTVAQAQNQNWSHLIFAGLNEGAWPPPAKTEFAREEEIHAFNRRIQQLNQRAARQGSHGEGHVSVRENYSLYLGPTEQRAIALRQFDSLLESAGDAVTLAASLVQEDAPERFWNPSECFTALYLQHRGEPLTQAALKGLQRATALLPASQSSAGDVQQTLTAFNVRRDSSTPAGEYDFAFRSNEAPPLTPTLSVSDLESMVKSPAIVWMKRYLRIEAPEESGTPWPAATGKWVHQWLAKIHRPENGRLFAPLPSTTLIDREVCEAADERRLIVERLCHSLGKTIPDWWQSGWLNAIYLTRHLGKKVGEVKNWGWIAAELPIGRDGAVKIGQNTELQMRGQIDLLLAVTEATDFRGQKIWIVDYKTGGTKELKDSDLHDSLVKGTALQLGLYALAIRALGATEVDVSIVSFAVKVVAPQLSVTDLEEQTAVFAGLATMQRTGIFGMKGEIRPAFGYGPAYPLATLPIDNDVLEDKWALTHPDLVLEKEETETW